MNILAFIASLNWPDGEMDRRIADLDAQHGADSMYDASMLLTEEEYQQYLQLPKPNKFHIQLAELC